MAGHGSTLFHMVAADRNKRTKFKDQHKTGGKSITITEERSVMNGKLWKLVASMGNWIRRGMAGRRSSWSCEYTINSACSLAQQKIKLYLDDTDVSLHWEKSRYMVCAFQRRKRKEERGVVIYDHYGAYCCYSLGWDWTQHKIRDGMHQTVHTG